AGRSSCSTSPTSHTRTERRRSRVGASSPSASMLTTRRSTGPPTSPSGLARSRPVRAAGTSCTAGSMRSRAMNPVVNPHLSTSVYAGVPQIEPLVTDWVRATDQAKRKQVADEIQKVAFGEVVYVPWGEWLMPTAFRKNVHGILKFNAPLFWNVQIV